MSLVLLSLSEAHLLVPVTNRKRSDEIQFWRSAKRASPRSSEHPPAFAQLAPIYSSFGTLTIIGRWYADGGHVHVEAFGVHSIESLFTFRIVDPTKSHRN
jgi:hypothetical protein